MIVEVVVVLVIVVRLIGGKVPLIGWSIAIPVQPGSQITVKGKICSHCSGWWNCKHETRRAIQGHCFQFDGTVLSLNCPASGQVQGKGWLLRCTSDGYGTQTQTNSGTFGGK